MKMKIRNIHNNKYKIFKFHDHYDFVMKGKFFATLVQLHEHPEMNAKVKMALPESPQEVSVSWKAYASKGSQAPEKGDRMLVLKYRIRPKLTSKYFNFLPGYYESIGFVEFEERAAERLKEMDIQKIETICGIMNGHYYDCGNHFFHRNALIPFSRSEEDIRREKMKIEIWNMIKNDPEFRMDLLLHNKPLHPKEEKHGYLRDEFWSLWAECERIKEEMED